MKKYLVIYALVATLLASSAYADVGDVVKVLGDDDDPLPVSGIPAYCSVGLGFDGTNLYYDRCGDPLVYLIDPLDATLVDTFDTTGLMSGYPNAMAFDSTRNGFWIGTQSCHDGELPVYFWDLDDDSFTQMFTLTSAQGLISYCFLDGIAFNANGPGEADDEIFVSDDVHDTVGVFNAAGVFLRAEDATDIDSSLSETSGLAVGGPNLYLGNNGGMTVFRANIASWTSLGSFAHADGRQEDMECDPDTFAPVEVMWVRTTPQGGVFPDVITAYEIEPATCGLGGAPPVDPYCGDGIVNQDPEQCDDGNNEDGDGCSANCIVEEPDEEPAIPEFTAIGAGLALLGAGLYGYRKRK